MRCSKIIQAALEAILVKVSHVPAEHRPNIDGEVNALRELMQDGSETACAIVPDDDLSPDEDESDDDSDLDDCEDWHIATGKFSALFCAYRNGLQGESLLSSYEECIIEEHTPEVAHNAWKSFVNHLLEATADGVLDETETFSFILTTDRFFEVVGIPCFDDELESTVLELKLLVFHLKGRNR